MGTLKLNKKCILEKTEAHNDVAEVETAISHENDIHGSEISFDLQQDDGFLSELKDKRNFNSIDYRRNNRTKRHVIFASPQFYKDDSGEYVEINNKLSDNDQSIVNSDSSYKIEFVKENNDKIFNLKKGNKKISLSLDTHGSGSNSKACKCQLCANADNAVTVQCNDGEEIQYVALSDRIKENIIINERKEKYEYSFLMNIGDLVVEEGDNCILLKDPDSNAVEFIIPAPYMYDAKKVYSHKVSYEIDVNGEEMAIKVIADSNFINSDKREFPVIIDPQIEMGEAEGGVRCISHVQYFDEDEGNATFPNTGLVAGVQDTDDEWDSMLYYDFTIPDYVKENVLISIKVLLRCLGGDGDFKIDGQDYNAPRMEGKIIEIDITDNTKGVIRVTPNKRTSDFPWVTLLFEKIVIDYLDLSDPYYDRQYEDVMPYMKEFNLSDNVTGHLEVRFGGLATSFTSVDCSDFVLPIKISHVHKLGSGKTNYGLNWHLNIEKTLQVAIDDTIDNTRYLYTDELGDKYIFSEKYYYILDGIKHFINKNDVEIDINGNLTYGSNKVYKYQSCNGNTLIPEINDFRNFELIDQRQSEQAEIEDFLNNYKTTLSSYVVVRESNGAIITSLRSLTKDSYDYMVGFLRTGNLLMTSSEQMQLARLYEVPSEESPEAEKIREQDKKNLIQQAKDNLENIKTLFIKYFRKEEELKMVLIQTPVNYIKDSNGLISGFNSKGNLVMIADSYDNYVNIIYDSYNRIDSIYDSNDKFLKFEYLSGKLLSITDSLGRKISYSYDSDKLVAVTKADGETLTFKYSSNLIRTIDSSKEIQAKLSYNDKNRVTEIKNWSRPLTIGKTVSRTSDSYSVIIDDYSITYAGGDTIIEDAEGNRESLYFFGDGKIKTEYMQDNEYNATRTNYEYEEINGRKITATTTQNNERPIVNIKQYDEIDLLVMETDDWHDISETVRAKTVKEYNYDINNNLIEEKVSNYTEENGEEKVVVSFTKYCYNAEGGLLLTESYVEGEELTSGKTYVSNEYDKNGNVIKTITWNSLDSSTKFYEENDYDDKGLKTADRDETGEVFAEYEYIGGTNIVNAVKYSDGSKFAYGRNPYNYEVTSVTQSTEQDEANTTDILHTYGLPVEVKSGNTALEYTYDGKRRTTQVKVNGTVQITTKYNKGYKYNADDECCIYYDYTDTLYVSNNNTVSLNYQKGGTLDEETGLIEVEESLTIDKKEMYSKTTKAGLLKRVKYSQPANTTTFDYSYDEYDKLIEVTTTDGNTLARSAKYEYNGEGDLIQYDNGNNQTYKYYYKDDSAHSLDYIELGNLKFYPLSDVYGRNTGKEILNGSTKVAAEYISYRKIGNHGTNIPLTVWFANGSVVKDNIKYQYDEKGNISKIFKNGKLTTEYTYDSLNRIIKEHNILLDKEEEYEYDTNGNILHKYVGEDSYDYIYEGDKLKSYNGEEFEYNNLGCPIKYRNKTLTWEFGRNLKSFNGLTFVYDGLGRRISKGDITFTYDHENRLLRQSNGITYIYDSNGLAGFEYNDKQYFYRKDIQGNIIAILDITGKPVVYYEYDAWGNHAVLDSDGNDITDNIDSSDIRYIGLINPFRYRGYYYDIETDLYFLKTRYYDPELGRFISQDRIEYASHETINGLNLFAYCNNNPVMGYDPEGTLNWGKFWASFVAVASVISIVVGGILCATGYGAALGAVLIGAGIGGLVAEGSNFASQLKAGSTLDEINWGQVAFNGAIGMGIGAITASPLGAVSTGLSVAALTFSGSVGNDLFENKGDWGKVDWGTAALTSVLSGVVSGVGQYLVQNTTLMNKFINSRSSVQAAAEASKRHGYLGRASYTNFWKQVMIAKTVYVQGIKILTNLFRGIVNHIKI